MSGGSAYWRLLDPYGRQVWSQNFSDVATLVLPLSGTYTLLVEGSVSNTAAVTYSFNAQKITNTTAALTLGTQASGAITQPGQQNFFTFTLANAAQLYFDSLTNDSSLNWTLTGPRGTEVSQRSFTNSDSNNIGSTNPVVNLIAGDYTLAVAGSSNHLGSYAFRLSNLASATAITPGTPVSNRICRGSAADRGVDPRGRRIQWQRAAALSEWQPGCVKSLKLDEGSGLNFIDSSGHGNSAVLANAPAVESKLYSLQANAGDPFYFDAQSLSGGGSANWRLIDPYGQQVWSQGFSNVATTVLQSTGTYTLLVEGSVSNTSAVNYSFNAQKIVNPTTALTLGSLTTGVITQPGQQNRYTFTLANASQLYFDSLTNDPGLTWSLSGPRGFEASARFDLADAQNTSTPAISLIAGDYILTVSATGDHTGGYGFRLSDLAAVATVTPGTAVSGTLGDSALAVALTRTGFAAPIAYSSGTNRAAQFSNNYLTVSDSASLKPAQITVEAWVYADPRMSSWNGVAVKTTSSSWNDGYGLARYPDGTINFFVNSYIAQLPRRHRPREHCRCSAAVGAHPALWTWAPSESGSGRHRIDGDKQRAGAVGQPSHGQLERHE